MDRVFVFVAIVLLVSGFVQHAVAVEPSAYDQYMLELVNRARANPVAEASRWGLSDLNEGVSIANTISTTPK